MSIKVVQVLLSLHPRLCQFTYLTSLWIEWSHLDISQTLSFLREMKRKTVRQKRRKTLSLSELFFSRNLKDEMTGRPSFSSLSISSCKWHFAHSVIESFLSGSWRKSCHSKLETKGEWHERRKRQAVRERMRCMSLSLCKTDFHPSKTSERGKKKESFCLFSCHQEKEKTEHSCISHFSFHHRKKCILSSSFLHSHEFVIYSPSDVFEGERKWSTLCRCLCDGGKKERVSLWWWLSFSLALSSSPMPPQNGHRRHHHHHCI